MYIQKIKLSNIKVFDGFSWTLGEDDNPAGWHVLLGDNGSGKSSLLRACAAALMGPTEAAALRLDWHEWLGDPNAKSEIQVQLLWDRGWDKLSNPGASSKGEYIPVKLFIDGGLLQATKGRLDSNRYHWGTGNGWFSASFGPYRRFSGGNQEYEKLFYSKPKLARHLSLFGEDVALTETLSWLKDLRFQQLERKEGGQDDKPCTPDLLDQVIRFINQEDFLPNGTRLAEVTSKAVIFTDGNGTKVGIEALSDGYRSILSLTMELLRQLCICFDPAVLFSGDGCIQAPGVVLIDEIDVHLHPRWQRRIGPWLTRHFPKLQFFVTTHSPLICQGAEQGTVTRLPRPGRDEQGGRVTGPALNRLLYGNILEAYGSGAFGEGIERSEAGRERYQRLALLNRRHRKGQLSPQELKERETLQTIFPLSLEETEAQ